MRSLMRSPHHVCFVANRLLGRVLMLMLMTSAGTSLGVNLISVLIEKTLSKSAAYMSLCAVGRWYLPGYDQGFVPVDISATLTEHTYNSRAVIFSLQTLHVFKMHRSYLLLNSLLVL